jgi:hypothetical protein
MPTFVVNNKSYSSIEEMPPDVRQAYEQAMGVLADKNGNGVPDILEGAFFAGPVGGQAMSKVDTRFVVDGKVYSRVEDLPPEARHKYDLAIAKAGEVMGDANRNGVPDILEGMLPARSEAAAPQTDAASLIAPDRIPLGSTPPIVGNAPDNSGGGLSTVLNIAIAVALFALIALGLILLLPLLK